MRFGGHETFAIRAGWLSKGLRLLQTNEAIRFDDPATADDLGVGRNMAKSIGFWLTVTGLVERPQKDGHLKITEVGQLVLNYDPYFQQIATWWALHINMVTQQDAALTWQWFFSEFNRRRFSKDDCVLDFTRWLEERNISLRSKGTAVRDIACLLQSYATAIPNEVVDPEDVTDCPLRQLGLLVSFRDIGRYERAPKRFLPPPEILGYSFARLVQGGESCELELGLAQALSAANGPGKVLGLTSDELLELLAEIQELDKQALSIQLLGGERVVTVSKRRPTEWLDAYYQRVSA